MHVHSAQLPKLPERNPPAISWSHSRSRARRVSSRAAAASYAARALATAALSLSTSLARAARCLFVCLFVYIIYRQRKARHMWGELREGRMLNLT